MDLIVALTGAAGLLCSFLLLRAGMHSMVLRYPLAPGLFAEILFDGALSYTLYRRLRRRDSPHRLSTAFGQTAWPFGITAVFLMLVGAAMAAYAPGAHSIGEVAHYVNPAH